MSFRQRFPAAGAVLIAAFAAFATPAFADQGDCAQPVTAGQSPAATDCLFILQAAVGSQVCDPECICAPTGSLPVSATDALLCLAAATGQPVTLDCPCAGSTTSSTFPNTSTSVTTTTTTTTTTLGAPLDIRGTYVASIFVVADNCVPPEDGATTFSMDGSLTIDTQNDASYSGSGTFTETRDNTLFTLNIDVDGTVDGSGRFDGSYTETFSGGDFMSSGSGTYSGRVVLDTMTFEMTGTDTDSEGTTCDVDVDFAGDR